MFGNTKHQGGSMMNYLIVAVVATILVVGGIWSVKSFLSGNNQAEEKVAVVKKDNQKSQPNNKNKQSGQKQPNVKKKAIDKPPVVSGNTEGAQVQASSPLPQTGIEDTLLQSGVIFGLIFGVSTLVRLKF